LIFRIKGADYASASFLFYVNVNMAISTNDIIILRSVFGKVGQKYFIQPCRNPKTG
jgi:hypothetical protein